jgi:hypothetical protein
VFLTNKPCKSTNSDEKMMKELSTTLQLLRNRLNDLYAKVPYSEISIHVNAIEIAVCLVEYSVKTNPARSISKEEERWFEAGYYLDLIFGNSEWQDIVDLYYELVSSVKKRNFFR